MPTEQLEQADIRTRAAVNDEVVQHFEALHRPGRVTHDLLVLAVTLSIHRDMPALECLPSALLHVPHQDLASIAFLHGAPALAWFRRGSTVDCACEPHAEVNPDATVDGVVHDGLVVSEVEVGEEAERAEGEWEDRRNNALEEP